MSERSARLAAVEYWREPSAVTWARVSRSARPASRADATEMRTGHSDVLKDTRARIANHREFEVQTRRATKRTGFDAKLAASRADRQRHLRERCASPSSGDGGRGSGVPSSSAAASSEDECSTDRLAVHAGRSALLTTVVWFDRVASDLHASECCVVASERERVGPELPQTGVSVDGRLDDLIER